MDISIVIVDTLNCLIAIYFVYTNKGFGERTKRVRGAKQDEIKKDNFNSCKVNFLLVVCIHLCHIFLFLCHRRYSCVWDCRLDK